MRQPCIGVSPPDSQPGSVYGSNYRLWQLRYPVDRGAVCGESARSQPAVAGGRGAVQTAVLPRAVTSYVTFYVAFSVAVYKLRAWPVSGSP